MTKYALLVAGALVAGTHAVHAAATVKFAVGFADDFGGTYHLRSDYSFDSLGAPVTFTRLGTYYFGDGNFEPAVPSPHYYTPALAWHSGGLTYSVFDDNPQAIAAIPGLTLGVAVSPLVTAVGSDNTYCNPTGMTVASGGVTFLGYTQCFDATGSLVGTPYTYALWDR